MTRQSKKQVERTAQLEQANKVLGQLQTQLKALRKKKQGCSDLSNHLTGFYEEINKLAKGRAILEATSLIVDQANDIVRDAKQIVENDVYLDRIKEFIPAGNNPSYPDVLIVVRSVRQSLDRCSKEFNRQETGIINASTRARTVVGALECFLSGEENSEFGLKEDVDRYVVGAVDDSCFFESEDVGQECFDFDGLDSQPVEHYIRQIEDDDDDEEGEGDSTGGEGLEEEAEEEE